MRHAVNGNQRKDKRMKALASWLTSVALPAILPTAEADQPRKKLDENRITYQVYDAFQTVELQRWDRIIDQDVIINSPAAYGMRGLQPLKDWATAFTDLAYRIDLIDEHLALDAQGDGRGFITFNLHWKH